MADKEERESEQIRKERDGRGGEIGYFRGIEIWLVTPRSGWMQNSDGGEKIFHHLFPFPLAIEIQWSLAIFLLK